MKNTKNQLANDSLEVLEQVKKQYIQYIEASGLYKLPIYEGSQIQYQQTSPENPLTTNATNVKIS